MRTRHYLLGLTLYVTVTAVCAGLAGLAFAQDYDRRAFTHWTDEDRDGQNARAEVLIAWSEAQVAFTDERERTVATGQWTGLYTGEVFTEARQVDIDHVVPLAYAWSHGALGVYPREHGETRWRRVIDAYRLFHNPLVLFMEAEICDRH